MDTCFHIQSSIVLLLYGFSHNTIYKTSFKYMWELSYYLLGSILLQSQDNSSTNTHEEFRHLKETLVLKITG